MGWKVFVSVGLDFKFSTHWKPAQFAHEGNKFLDNLPVVNRLVELLWFISGLSHGVAPPRPKLPVLVRLPDAGLLKKACDTEGLTMVFLSGTFDLLKNMALIHGEPQKRLCIMVCRSRVSMGRSLDTPDMNFFLTLPGAVDVVGGLHAHERVHLYAESLLDA